jgi:hypothetical protein
MRRLDPLIHATAPSALQFSMDRRVKPGGDECRKSPFGAKNIISVHARASGNPGFPHGS